MCSMINSIKATVSGGNSERLSRQGLTWLIFGHFRGHILQRIDCTSTDNQTQQQPRENTRQAINFFHRGFNAHSACYIFSLFVFHLHHMQVDVVGPLPLNASLLLAVTTDYSDWLWAPAQRKRATMLYFANVFIYLLIFYGRFILRPWWTEVRESFARGGPWVSLKKLLLGFFPGHP